MEMTLKDFLKERGISEERITQLEEEKVDASVIAVVDVDALERFFPKYGDRIAIQNFCRNIGGADSKKKKGLIDRLRERIDKKKKKREKRSPSQSPYNSSDEDMPRKVSNRKLKDTRQIEIGWFCDGKQVRTRGGGGTRKVDVSKMARKAQIFRIAKDLFFPNNTSSKGNLDEFHLDLKDFNLQDVDETYTIDEFFNTTKLCRLRFYLSSDRIKTQGPLPILPSARLSRAVDTNRNVNSSGRLRTAREETVTSGALERIQREGTVTCGASETTRESQQQEVLSASQQSELLIGDVPDITASELYDVLVGNVLDGEEIQSQTSEQASEENDTYANISLHRGQVLNELIDAFKAVKSLHGLQINIQMYMTNGKQEAGLDIGGVFRDALSEFWECFYNSCTNGTTSKVPIIREDYNEEKWQAVAKIIVVGWRHVKYFPIKLSRVFIESSIYSEFRSDIIEDFLNTLSNSDRNTLKTAISDITKVDQDEMIDIFSNLECKRVPTQENIKELMADLAHKELIQQPKYIIDCWQPILKQFIDFDTLLQIYEGQEPTPKNVSNMILCISENSSEETKTLTYLKKFIRESERTQLERFLRFCTGADCITGNLITVQFNNNSGIYRTPTAQTCSCVLELPTTYENFADFRTELNNVLSSNYWVMDLS